MNTQMRNCVTFWGQFNNFSKWCIQILLKTFLISIGENRTQKHSDKVPYESLIEFSWIFWAGVTQEKKIPKTYYEMQKYPDKYCRCREKWQIKTGFLDYWVSFPIWAQNIFCKSWIIFIQNSLKKKS